MRASDLASYRAKSADATTHAIEAQKTGDGIRTIERFGKGSKLLLSVMDQTASTIQHRGEIAWYPSSKHHRAMHPNGIRRLVALALMSSAGPSCRGGSDPIAAGRAYCAGSPSVDVDRLRSQCHH